MQARDPPWLWNVGQTSPEVVSWYTCTALCSSHRRSWVSLGLHQCLWTCLQVPVLKRLSCRADLHTDSRCRTRGESLRIIQARKHARDPPWLWNPGQTSPEVQNRGISDPHKNYLCPQNFFKKKTGKGRTRFMHENSIHLSGASVVE